MISPAIADLPDMKLAPPGAAGNTFDQNRLTPCPRRLCGIKGDLKIGEAKRKSQLTCSPAIVEHGRRLDCDPRGLAAGGES
jgi:hypothetical protein